MDGSIVKFKYFQILCQNDVCSLVLYKLFDIIELIVISNENNESYRETNSINKEQINLILLSKSIL